MIQRFGVVILAAGASARLGRPKQLLPYLGKTLIEHAARTAIASGADEIVVVVGADGGAIREKLKGLPVRVVLNPDWASGMGSSIRRGIGALGSGIECAVIALCDQPRITPDLLRNLAQRHFETGSSIVASSYDGILGAPSAFGKDQFPSLLALAGNTGARDLIRQSAMPIETVEFSGGNIDVDVAAEIPRLIPSETVEGPRDVCRKPQGARGPPKFFFNSLSTA
jgi:molybdenum cofactor cytidylyltransferase